jgi:AcrR family transcriptional regulator
LWNQTIAEHRRAVHDAILDTAATLSAAHGFAAVTMSQIAERVGIGRATLYKYFPDVASVIGAWHERQTDTHLDELVAAGRDTTDPGERLKRVLATCARLAREHGDLFVLLHRGPQIDQARQRLRDHLTGLVAEAAAAGHVRADVPAEELAGFCLYALSAAANHTPEAAERLLTVTLAGIARPGA